MVRHDYKFTQGGGWEMLRNHHPALSNQVTQCAGYKPAVRDATKDAAPLMRANRDEILAWQRIVAILQPNRPAIPSGRDFQGGSIILSLQAKGFNRRVATVLPKSEPYSDSTSASGT